MPEPHPCQVFVTTLRGPDTESTHIKCAHNAITSRIALAANAGSSLVSSLDAKQMWARTRVCASVVKRKAINGSRTILIIPGILVYLCG